MQNRMQTILETVQNLCEMRFGRILGLGIPAKAQKTLMGTATPAGIGKRTSGFVPTPGEKEITAMWGHMQPTGAEYLEQLASQKALERAINGVRPVQRFIPRTRGAGAFRTQDDRIEDMIGRAGGLDTERAARIFAVVDPVVASRVKRSIRDAEADAIAQNDLDWYLERRAYGDL